MNKNTNAPSPSEGLVCHSSEGQRRLLVGLDMEGSPPPWPTNQWGRPPTQTSPRALPGTYPGLTGSSAHPGLTWSTVPTSLQVRWRTRSPRSRDQRSKRQGWCMCVGEGGAKAGPHREVSLEATVGTRKKNGLRPPVWKNSVTEHILWALSGWELSGKLWEDFCPCRGTWKGRQVHKFFLSHSMSSSTRLKTLSTSNSYRGGRGRGRCQRPKMGRTGSSRRPRAPSCRSCSSS